MTLPALSAKYQKKITVTRLKRTYTLLSQAIALSEAQYGDVSGWDFTNKSALNIFEEYGIIDNIKKIKEEQFPRNGSNGITYKELSGKAENMLSMMGNGPGSKYFVLPDGTQLFLTKKSYDRGIIVDINGFSPPNQFGKDLFALQFN